MTDDRSVADHNRSQTCAAERDETGRSRVEWLRERVAGARVLLFGGSGVAPADLAGDGRQVLAFESEAEATEAELEPASFDTAVVVLQSTPTPERLLSQVCALLRPGGQLLISVPHGPTVSDGREQTYYAHRLLRIVAAHVEVTALAPTEDGFLCAAGVRPADGRTARPPGPQAILEWVARCEDGLDRIQRRLRQENAALQAERRMLLQRETDYCEGRTALTNERNELRRQVEAARSELESFRNTADEQQEAEKQRRRQAEAQAERFREQAEDNKTQLQLREQEVRYRLGDALVRAARPSLDTLKLAGRLIKLLVDGIRRGRERRAEAELQRSGPPAKLRPEPAGAAEPQIEPGRTRPASGGAPQSTLDTPREPRAALAKPYQTVPPELRRRNDVRLAAVTDEFSWGAWQFEAETYTFTPRAWRKVLSERAPDLLFVESTWRGIGDTWYSELRHLGSRSEVKYVVPDMVAWCRRHGIPTVFYSKEDPPNLEVFVDAARHFDYIYTSDANCIPHYLERVGHDRVFALPFAAQPRIHNPLMTEQRSGAVCFAGTWYARRHIGRREDAENILRPALEFDLHIYDRMAGSRDPAYAWPEEFRPALRGGLPYWQMLAAYKRYKVFLNVNSVKNSPTMFSRRVFELLACGTPVISSYSQGIDELLGGDVVLMSESPRTTRQLLERVLGDDEFRDRLSLRGQRAVLSDHTYTHRLQSVLDAIKLKFPVVGRPTLSMIAMIEDAAQLVPAWENYCRQSYDNKRLVLCATRKSAVATVDQVIGDDKSVRVVLLEGAAWGRPMRDAVKACRPGYVAAMNPGHVYGPHYLSDYANATLFVTGGAIGKASFYQAAQGDAPKVVDRDRQYRMTDGVNPWTLCLLREPAIQAADALLAARSPRDWWEGAMRRFDRIYSSDRFNYVRQLGAGDADARTAGPEAAGHQRLLAQAEMACA